MKKLFYLSLLSLLFYACSEPQQEFTHTTVSTDGLLNAEIAYVKADTIEEQSILSQELAKGDVVLQRVADGLYTITINDKNGTTTFMEIPSKYINLDATLEVTRNIFQDYFPEEWEVMKGSNYTAIYFKSKADNQVFYLKTVFTGSDKEIGMHSEDF